jgi:hypothetical protein
MHENDCRPTSDSSNGSSDEDTQNTVDDVIAETISFHEGPDSDADHCNYDPAAPVSSTSGGRPTRSSARRNANVVDSMLQPPTGGTLPASASPHPSSPGMPGGGAGVLHSTPLPVEESDDEDVPEGHLDLFATNLSATRRKLTLQGILENEGDVIDLPPPVTPPQYGLIEIGCLNAAIQGSLCSECLEPALKFSYESSQGLALKMVLTCQDCGHCQGKGFSSPLLPGVPNTQGRRPFDIHRRVAFTLRQIGCGQAELDMLTTYLNMPSSIHHKTLHQIVLQLWKDMEPRIAEFFRSQAIIVRKIYETVDEENINRDVIDISVSYDGTWQRRGGGGHVSNYGIGFVIEIVSGLAIDFYVMSKYCFGCVNAPAKDSPDYANWEAKHAPKCQKNYSGSSGNMEVHGAVKIWQRSIEKNKFRYSTFIGDGDSAACVKLNEIEVYGPDVQIRKEECINHVSKRMFTALTNLKKKRQPGEVIGGRGGLTDELIKKLSNYFGKAIKDKNTVEEMQNEIWAGYYHTISTDENPQHDRCPEGEQSWCFYRREEALHPDGPPPPHKGHSTIKPEIGRKMVDIYTRLSKEDLLSRCLHGRTSNPNERLNGKVWEKVPKEIFRSKVHIDIASALAVMEFNAGTKPVDTLMTQLHIPLATSGQDALVKQDQLRVKKSNIKITEGATRRRKTLKLNKAKKSDQDRNKEGQVYGPGLLDTLENRKNVDNAKDVDHSSDADTDNPDNGPTRKKVWQNKGPQGKKSKKN